MKRSIGSRNVFSVFLTLICVMVVPAVSGQPPSPHFFVTPQHDHLWGHDWPANDTVTVKLGDPAEEIGTADTNEWGDFWLDSPGEIQPGDLVQVECGEILKTHVVTELTVTAVDPDSDTVSGTAAPETWVSVGMHDVHLSRHVQADKNGDWVADFSEAVGPDPWNDAYDITAGDEGNARQEDEDRDGTFVNWLVPDPVIVVDLFYNTINGHGWPSVAEVEVTIGDTDDPDFYETIHANAWGEWWLHVEDDLHVLQAGDVVTADDGTHLRTMTVPVLEVTGVDPDNNVVSGLAPAETEIAVRIGEVTLYVTADEHGEWNADFSGHVDIEEGTEGRLSLHDEHGNVTETRWRYATLDIWAIEMVKISIPEEDYYVFELIIEGDGLLSARFQAPSGEWYDLLEDWDEWLFWKLADSMEAIDAEFTTGEYLLELTHYHGVTTVTLEFPEDVEKPNATPVVIAPQERRSDVDPADVMFEWQNVDDPNFQFIFRFVEDELFHDLEDGWAFIQFDPAEDDMPTQDMVPGLQADRIYSGGVGFANIEGGLSSGDIEMEYAVIEAIFGTTAFSTNTDEELFDPIELVLIDRGREGEGGYTFEFEIEFSESLQSPGESTLFHRLNLWTPEDEYYTLFDATQQNEFGDFVGLYIEEDHLEELPGSDWYALVVQKDDESAVATWFLFAEPDSEEPLQMPEQMPVITQPQPDAVVANPVTFSWDPVTDEAVNLIGVFHAPEEFIVLSDEATEYSPSEDLPVGPQHMLVVFVEAYLDLFNADSIPYNISQYIANGVDFTVGYTLTYESGAGGWLEGPVQQVVAPGVSGEFVKAFAEEGAVFQQWDDGYINAGRTDDEVHADATFTAHFSSEGGVPIDWYADHNLAPEEDETWADLDEKDEHDKGMTLAEEFIALTDPNVPESRFIVEELSGPPFQIWFKPSSPERLYTLEYTEDLLSDEWDEVKGQGPRPGAGGGDEDYMENEGSEALRFYRVKVELP